jgi:hypothetical protein
VHDRVVQLLLDARRVEVVVHDVLAEDLRFSKVAA